MEIPDDYKGREHSFIKHRLLEAYIQRLFMIIGQYESRICFVDCFAGPWKAESDNLKDTSIAISLNIMKECYESLKKQGKKVQFKALYIEKNREAYKILNSFLNKESTNEVRAESLYGDFYSLRADILKWCGDNDFTFFFIDPKGWKNVVEIDTLRPLLQRKRSEYLINFMFDFILRVHNQAIFEEHMIRIFGEIPDTNGMRPLEREEYLLDLYRTHLKNAQPDIKSQKSRSAYVKILDSYKDRTKYDLVYLTRHPLGIKVFMEASEKLDLDQKSVRAKVKQKRRIDKSGQMELFPAEINIPNGNKTNLSEVKNYWQSKLTKEPKRFGYEELADMLEETGWFISDFQKAFNELISEGKAKNLNASRKRPVHAVHFEKGEFLRRSDP